MDQGGRTYRGENMAILRIFLLIFLSGYVGAEYALFECPTGWEDFGEHCYRFMNDVEAIAGAKQRCRELGDRTYPLTINSDQEHNFIVDQLKGKYDRGHTKRDWWTSGRRKAMSGLEFMEFYWEGDGRAIESYFYWHNTSIPREEGKGNIIYNFYGVSDEWGWILGYGTEKNPFICKISKEDIYLITEEKRGPGYGVDDPDEGLYVRGPKITVQPVNTIFELSILGSNSEKSWAGLECHADGYPAASYRWFKERAGLMEEIDPSNNERYTFINGKLIVHEPSQSEGDDGTYHCVAHNSEGAVLSNMANFEFGYINDFPRDTRSPVSVPAYTWGSIECSPPDHYPDSITYSWYKDDPSNWVRPRTKPYIFISQDGTLYFSMVTVEDVGDYYCMVGRPGITSSSGAKSEKTHLDVKEATPGTYEPVIQKNFPRVYPSNPMVGDSIRIECFASGTADPDLEYSWKRVQSIGEDASVPLPLNSEMTDHNRVLNIKNVKMYDQGVYRCRVNRKDGLSDEDDVQLDLRATPYFIVELEDQYLDTKSTLRWRCEAGGKPQPDYSWFKNGIQITNDTNKDPDNVKISNNVLTITNADEERHNGVYQCAATNDYGTRYSAGELKVISFAPKFTKQPLPINQFATERGNTTLFCKPEAAPWPEITWFKDGRRVTGDGRLILMPNGNLFISSIELTDGGVYKCEAKNEIGEASSQGNLTILDTVSISYSPAEAPSMHIVNKTSFLHCVASYNPQLDVTYVWYQNDIMIQFDKVYRLGENVYELWVDPHFKRGSGHYNGGLYLMNAQFMHTGRYTCVVETTLGDKFASYVDIAVQGPPSEPAGVYVDGATLTSTSVVIQWIRPNSNGPPITSYVLETFNHWEQFWRIHETNIFLYPADDKKLILRYNVTDLRPYSLYQFRMRAENNYGTSTPSTPSDIVNTTEVPPDLYPAFVGGGGGKVGVLTVKWEPFELWEENGLGFHYIIYSKKAGDAEWGENNVKVPKGHWYAPILVGKDNFYKPYDVAVQGVNRNGSGPLSPTVTIRSAMRMPSAVATNVRAQPFNSTACIVTWVKVKDDREELGGKLGGYKVAYWHEKYGNQLDNASRITLNGQVEEGLIIGLEPDSVYYFGVYVWNDAGNAPISDTFPQRTLRRSPINQPVEVKVYLISTSSIHVFWRGVSTSYLEEPLQGYKVRIWREGTVIKSAEDYDAKRENDLKIYGLNPDIKYKLRVFGFSRGGDGTMSSPAVEFMLGGVGTVQASILMIALSTLLAVCKTLL